jgi:hypothetical protein
MELDRTGSVSYLTPPMSCHFRLALTLIRQVFSKNFRSMRSWRTCVVELSAREYYYGILHRAVFISIHIDLISVFTNLSEK